MNRMAVNPMWMYEGQVVYVRATLVDSSQSSTTGLRCTVQKACGNTALVANESRGFRRWMDKYDLWIKPEDSKHKAGDVVGCPVAQKHRAFLTTEGMMAEIEITRDEKRSVEKLVSHLRGVYELMSEEGKLVFLIMLTKEFETDRAWLGSVNKQQLEAGK